MSNLYVMEIFVKSQDGIETISSCKLKNIEVVEIYQTEFFDMAYVREFHSDER